MSTPAPQRSSGPAGLARYAADAGDPGPRAFREPEAAGRSPFARDRDRLIHSVSFRRLAQKTQVLGPEGGVHRTRLTHTLEVAQIARSLARALALDEDLAEALALAHDLGHGPFGHTGEDALTAAMAPWGGFDHNEQSLRIVVELERRYLDFDGLNLTLTTLEGMALRKGPVSSPGPVLHRYARELGLRLDLWPHLEAQVAARADDIAYNAHDLEDGLRAGLVQLPDALTVPVVAEIAARLRAGRGTLDADRLPFALARGLIDLFAQDVVGETRRQLARAVPGDATAVGRFGHALVSSSAELLRADHEVKAFLLGHMYRHPDLQPARERARALVEHLARELLADPGRMPEPWRSRATEKEWSDADRARTVCDYVSGLTDREAERAHAGLFDARDQLH